MAKKRKYKLRSHLNHDGFKYDGPIVVKTYLLHEDEAIMDPRTGEVQHGPGTYELRSYLGAGSLKKV